MDSAVSAMPVEPAVIDSVHGVAGCEDGFLPLLDLNARTAVPGAGGDDATQFKAPRPVIWAAARLAFHAYVGFALLSVVGGFLTAPLMTKLFFGDWRFWRYWREGSRLFLHGWRLAGLMLRGEGSFMLSVPLASAPRSAPDLRRVALAPEWREGGSCGSCRRCCQIASLRCPVLDTRTGLCRGYDAFYWRYFNCGRYPSAQAEIDYYDCPKWRVRNPAGAVCGGNTL